MAKCKDCFCNCHCNVKGHSDSTGVCPCEKCNKMCHCPNAEGECTNCDCGHREEDATYEGGGVVIDDTGECESCQ